MGRGGKLVSESIWLDVCYASPHGSMRIGSIMAILQTENNLPKVVCPLLLLSNRMGIGNPQFKVGVTA
jgi:hypothetical protein